METTEMTTEILNDLVQINNDRIVGYERAMKELKDGDADLKELFSGMINESIEYKSQLVSAGASPENDTTNSGKIYRVWMDVKAVFTGHDRKAVLENCEFGEDAAQKAYDTALAAENLPSDVRALLSQQKQNLRASHDRIKLLRDFQK
ncbi:PA2169 family four-helix-bundle protein [Paradesertivirga mongoliensis]|uniref:PA2169 family four-helix-bundle protein n=1 Tax=Paradesertivirga mongoliensis TaxID=2100740 RepID=A0ABW4ZMQ2_9SPHI|nr:PA2169 family four-helix-bundle protein [Pedobacter mongoliensis]